MTTHQPTLTDVLHQLRRKADGWDPGPFRDGLIASLNAVAREMRLDELGDPTANHTIPGRRATSRSAALDALPRAGTQRWRVLHALADQPSTDEQLAGRLRLRTNTIRPRRLELLEGGWVCDSGDRFPTPMGNPAIVWTLTAEGRARLPHIDADESARMVYGIDTRTDDEAAA
jgi:hypothetical protein